MYLFIYRRRSNLLGCIFFNVIFFIIQLQQVFVNCIGDLFENQVVLFEGILKSGRYISQVWYKFLLSFACFSRRLVHHVSLPWNVLGTICGKFVWRTTLHVTLDGKWSIVVLFFHISSFSFLVPDMNCFLTRPSSW